MRPTAPRSQWERRSICTTCRGIAHPLDVGAGANFAFGCDRVMAARSASFIQTFSEISLIPECGGAWLVPNVRPALLLRLAWRSVSTGCWPGVQRLDEAARYAPLEHLSLNPQCGFSSIMHGSDSAVKDQRRKLALMAETAAEF